jgi:hypothetical protein
MTNRTPVKLTNTQLKEFGALFGAPSVLTSESESHYHEIWQKLIECFMPHDFMELLLIRQVQNETWKIMRYTRHQTIAIDRRFRQSLEFQAQRKKEQLVRREALAKEFADKTGRPVTEISQLIHLAAVIDSTLPELHDLQRIATDLEHNHALKAGIALQQQLDRLIDAALARRNDALEQLELYQEGLGRRWRQIADEIIDAEVTEIAEPAKAIEAPQLVPDNQALGGPAGGSLASDGGLPSASLKPSAATSSGDGA